MTGVQTCALPIDDGIAGAVVRVRRADDKKVVLRARVLDSETVEVDVP